MPESCLWALDEEGRVITLSTLKCAWKQVKGRGSKINHFKKLSSATWCLWTIGCDHQPYLMVHSSDVKIRYQEVLFENERRKLMRSYSSRYLKSNDPCHMHHMNSKLPVTKESLKLPSSRWSWEDDWRIKETINGELTDKGWQYAPNFNSEFSSQETLTCSVRRRKWIRFRRFSALDRWLLLPLDENHPSRSPLLDLCVGGEMMAHQQDGYLSIWAVNLKGELLYRQGVDRVCPEGNQWVNVDGPEDEFILCVSVGSTGSVWICTDQGCLYVRTGVTWHCPIGSGWLYVEPPDKTCRETIVHLAVGVYATWAVANTGSYWYRREVNAYEPSKIGGTRWTPMVGKVRSISIGPSDQAWAVDQDLCQLLHRTGVTPSSRSGKVWRYVDLPLIVRTPSRSSSSSQEASHFSLSVEEIKSLQKNETDLIEERNPYNVEMRKFDDIVQPDHNNSHFYSIFNEYPLDSVCYTTNQESPYAPTDSAITEESETSNSLVNSLNVSQRETDELPTNCETVEEIPTPQCHLHSEQKGEALTTTYSSAMPENCEDVDEEEVFVENSQSLCALRCICASSLYLDEGQSIQKWLANSKLYKYEECSSSGNPATISKSSSNSLRHDYIISPAGSDSNSDSNVWKIEISQLLFKRDKTEYKNPQFRDYDLAVKQSSWRESVKCQVILSTDTAAEDFEKLPRLWLESEFSVEQWRQKSNSVSFCSIDGFLKLEYKVKKKLSCEILPVTRISCLARVPLVESNNSVIQCLAVYINKSNSRDKAHGVSYENLPKDTYVTTVTGPDGGQIIDSAATSAIETSGSSSGEAASNEAIKEIRREDETSQIEISEALPSVQTEIAAEMIHREHGNSENVFWLVRLNSEEEVDNWLRILFNLLRERYRCCQPSIAQDPLPSKTTRKSTGWIISGAIEALKTSDLQGNGGDFRLDQMTWHQVPGHFRSIECGMAGSPVTWAIGHNGMAWTLSSKELSTSENCKFNTVQRDSRLLDVYEHQRARFFSGSVFDHYMWGDENGAVYRTQEQVVLTSGKHCWSKESDWTIDFTIKGGSDPEGWQYSKEMGNYEAIRRWNFNIRRRKWVREYQVSATAPWREVKSTERLKDVSIRSDSRECFLTHSFEVDVWAVSCQGAILRRKGVTADKPEGTNWVQILGEQCFQSVSISSEHQLWAVGEDGSAWLRRGVSPDSEGSSWAHVGFPDNSQLLQISAGEGWIIWTLDSKGRLWSRKDAQPVLPEGTEWLPVPLPFNSAVMCQVSCGSKRVWAVCKTNKCLYERLNVTQDNPIGDSWIASLKGLVCYASVRGILPHSV